VDVCCYIEYGKLYGSSRGQTVFVLNDDDETKIQQQLLCSNFPMGQLND
jgi:hypothetical protein